MHTFSLIATAVALSSTTAAAAFDLTTSFATKSSYWDQSKDVLGAGAFAKQATPEQEAEYTLVQIQNVVRHGTRFPTKGNTIEIEDLLKKLQTNYGDVIPAWLQTYKLPYNVSVEGELAAAGTKETQAFGARSRTRVGDAVPRKYSSDKYLVEHTYKPRTKDTAKAFIAGFFSNPEDVVLVEHSKKSDLLFRFFDECPRYESQIADNATAQTELTAFKATPTFQKTIGSLRTALNLPADANITAKDVESAFSACAFDLALYGIRDAWCTLLSEDFIETNDYAEDLETFMEHGGGAKISYEISAVLLRDIYQDFTKFAGQQNGSLVGHLRFVHAETVLPLMTLLGYADKTPLSGTATASQIANRKFRSSRLSPFMANIEFRLYTKRSRSGTTKCRSLEEDDEGGEVKYYAQIRLNEQVTAVPGCDGKVFCSLSKLKKIWGYYLNDYNFAAECKV